MWNSSIGISSHVHFWSPQDFHLCIVLGIIKKGGDSGFRIEDRGEVDGTEGVRLYKDILEKLKEEERKRQFWFLQLLSVGFIRGEGGRERSWDFHRHCCGARERGREVRPWGRTGSRSHELLISSSLTHTSGESDTTLISYSSFKVPSAYLCSGIVFQKRRAETPLIFLVPKILKSTVNSFIISCFNEPKPKW